MKNPGWKHRLVALCCAVFLLATSAAHALDVGIGAYVGSAPASGGGVGGGGSPAPSVVLTGPTVTNIQQNSARVEWTLNTQSDGMVLYGLTSAYEVGSVHDVTPRMAHALDLTGLLPATTYRLIVRSTTLTGSVLESSEVQFTTLPGDDGQPPMIQNLRIEQVTAQSAVVLWETNEPATTAVDVGLTMLYELGRFDHPGLTSVHRVELLGLTPLTYYEIRAISADASGNSASDIGQFRTLAPLDIIPPANPANLLVENVPNQAALLLTWQNPTDPDLAYIRIMRRDDQYPTSPVDGTLVFQGLANNFLDIPLVRGATYFYTLYAVDTSANMSSGAQGQGTVPLARTIRIRAYPEKRVPRTGNWGVAGALIARAPGTLTARETATAQTDALGEVVLEMLINPGVHDFAFKGSSHLRVQQNGIDVLEAGETYVDFTRGNTRTMLAGDVHASQDNAVNALDISALLSRLGTGFVVTDLNRDGLVNSLDITVLLANLSRRGEP